MLKNNVFGIAALIAVLLAVILCSVSMATHQWANASSGPPFNATIHTGLWGDCICQKTCKCSLYAKSNPKIPLSVYMKVSQATSCLGLIFDAVAIVLLGLQLANLNLLSQPTRSVILQLVLLLFLGLAVLWYLIAVITFATKHKTKNKLFPDAVVKQGYSWALMIGSAFLNAVALVLTGFSRRKVHQSAYQTIQ